MRDQLFLRCKASIASASKNQGPRTFLLIYQQPTINIMHICLFHFLSFIFQNIAYFLKTQRVTFGQNFMHDCPGILCPSVLNSPWHLHHWSEGRGLPLGGSSCCLCREARKRLLWKRRRRGACRRQGRQRSLCLTSPAESYSRSLCRVQSGRSV